MIRDLTEAWSRRLLVHMCVCMCGYTHAYTWCKREADGREQRVSRSLARSSNEESSRIPVRRSTLSVSTRLAIRQHVERDWRCVCVCVVPRQLGCFLFRASIDSTIREERYAWMDNSGETGILFSRVCCLHAAYIPIHRISKTTRIHDISFDDTYTRQSSEMSRMWLCCSAIHLLPSFCLHTFLFDYPIYLD